MNTWGKKSLGYINKKGLNEDVREFLLYIEKRLPFECSITDTMRTAEEQNILYKRKVTKCDGYTKKSNHQSGMAFDIVPSKSLWNASNDEWLAINECIERCWKEFCKLKGINMSIGWGGQWKSFVDKPHYEVK